MTLSVFAMPFKGTAPNTAVAVTIEAAGTIFGFDEKDGKLVTDYEVSTIAIDQQGKIRGGDRSVINFAIKPENRARFAQTGVRVATRLQLPPGRYQLRVAARESGRVASARSTTTSTCRTSRRIRSRSAAWWSPRPQGCGCRRPSPTRNSRACSQVRRSPYATFPRGDELAVFAEVYDNDVKAPHVVDITTTVVSEDGRNVFKSAEERATPSCRASRAVTATRLGSRPRNSRPACIC